MYTQRYSFIIELYKGEGRLLFVPLIDHTRGYRCEMGHNITIEQVGDENLIGAIVLELLDEIGKSPLSNMRPREEDEAWRNNTKYKTWISFWKNNNYVLLKFYEDGHYQIYSSKRSEKRKGNYSNVIKTIELVSDATTQDIGKAIIDVFNAAEEYHKNNESEKHKCVKKIQLLNNAELTFNEIQNLYFVDSGDSGAAEIYQCYSYATSENAEPAGEFFLGIAPELDYDLKPENVRSSWEDYYGKTDFFEMKEVNYGIFKYRVEMRNKESHKISYLLRQEEDLLLECGMEVHNPNRRKKTDKKLEKMFEEFALSCKM